MLRDAVRPGELARYLEQGVTAQSAHVRRIAESNELYRANTGRQVVSFRGDQPLSFAFQAARLRFDDGEYLDYASASGLAGFELSVEPTTGSPGQLLLDNDALDPFE